MKPPYASEIRSHFADALGGALGQLPDARSIHLPAKAAHASFRPPQKADIQSLLTLDYGSLYGAPLVKAVREVNGWLLFDFSPAFFSALVDEINASPSAPDANGETHAENRMRALARHSGLGCPDIPAFHRAIIEAVVAHESPAAYRRAERAALSLFHTIPPRERPALFPHCGALGGAILRLLIFSR